MTPKEILAKIKAMFDAPAFTPAAAAPAAAVPGAAAAPTPIPTPTIFKLKDGTEISVMIDDPAVSALPDVGDMVTVTGAPAPAGDYVLEDGTTLTVDATGAITAVSGIAPATQPNFAPPVAKTLEERIAAIEGKINAPLTMAAIEGAPGLTAEMVAEMYAKFATGTTEERIGNLEVMIKALMECNFGYQIRQGQEAEAIVAYKNSISPVQTGLATAEAKIAKQEEIIKSVLELAEKLVGEPTAEPVTLNGARKEKFDKMAAKNERLERIAAAMKEIKSMN